MVEYFYTYDALHRVTSARENYGNAWRNYTYDSLGNLTYEENSNNVQYDYKLNDLNQITEKYYSGGRERTVYTYDGRGNLVLEEYGKNKKLETVASYVYDETNKMVLGTNATGETSAYLYNGLNALVEQTWVIAKNGYGYHDVDATAETQADEDIILLANGKGDQPGGSDVKKTSTVVKQFVIDYTRETMDPLMEHEVNGLDYRYVYGLERLSVNISPIENGAGHVVESGTVGIQIRLYYHQDLRGTVDYLTSPVSQKVESWTHYNEWGEITHNAVLKMGLRELDLLKNYTGHDYDVVLNLYYAKARMYDAENRRFLSIDPILDGTEYDLTEYVYEVVNFTAYLYVRDNPLRWVDPLGLRIVDRNNTLTMLQDGGGTTAGLDSAAQNTTTKAPQANITPIDPDPQPGPPKDVIVPQAKEPQYGNIKQTFVNWPLLLLSCVSEPLIAPIICAVETSSIMMNYIYNSTLPQITGYIYGQYEEDVAGYKYGFYYMQYNGCGVIANYNALVALENPQSLNDVANWCETHGSILRGTLGTLPYSTRQLFESLGYKVKAVFNPAEFDAEAMKADACIFTYMWVSHKPPYVGMHTVYVKVNENTFDVYNEYGNATGPTPETSFSAWLTKGTKYPIALYCIYK